MLLSIWKSSLALSSVLPATLAFTFVNPASSGGQTSFAKNLVYQENSALRVEWTIGEADQDATVALFQIDLRTSLPTDTVPETLGDLEYVAGKTLPILLCTRKDAWIHADIYLSIEGQAFNRNTRNWIVATGKDLSTSPVFMMMLFVTGATTSSDRTVYFNISSADSTTSSASTSALTAASVSATDAASIPTSFNPGPATTAAASGLPSASSTSAEGSSALPSVAKIGLGVGIPTAAIVGIGLGWLAFRRGKAQGKQQSAGRYPLEDRSMGFATYPADTLKPSSSVATSASPSNKSAYGPPSNAPAYGPPSNIPAHGLQSNAPAYGPVSNAPVYRAASTSPVYEANNESPGPSELYAPYNPHH